MNIDNLIKKSIKVLDIDNIKIVGKNRKYLPTVPFRVSTEYREFQKEIYFSTQRIKLDPPYFLFIKIKCAHDIDGPESGIIDAMQGRAYKNDKDIDIKLIEREKIKRGSPGSIKAYVASIKQGKT